MNVLWVTRKDAEQIWTSVGWFGGFFDHGMRWSDYLEQFPPGDWPALEALRTSIIERKIWTDGAWHDGGESTEDTEDEEVIPVISGVPGPGGGIATETGTKLELSWRAWGDLMAAVWSSELNRDFCYMDFYAGAPLPPKEFFA